MKSPFPGMDPYIEANGLWGDFHYNLVYKIYESLAQAAPDRYVVRTGERSYVVLVESEAEKRRPFVPDVSVTGPNRPRKAARKKGGPAVAEADAKGGPVVLRAFLAEEHREAFVEIYEAGPGQRLVTAVEVLSPSNKQPDAPGWEQYQRKRQALLLGGVSLVEIDLLRGGRRMPMLDPWPDSPYTLLVARALDYERCRVWPAHFRRPLPPIPVPLAKPDPDLALRLQPMIEAIYERSRYGRSIDYTRPLSPPLGPDDTAWLERRRRARPKPA